MAASRLLGARAVPGGFGPGANLLVEEAAGAGADPVAAAERSEAMAAALEGIGAAVETERAGEIFFSVGGLRGLYGGEVAGVVAVAEGVVGAVVHAGRGGARGTRGRRR